MGDLACKRALKPPHGSDTTDGSGWMTRSPMKVYLFKLTRSVLTRSLTKTSSPLLSVYLHRRRSHSSFCSVVFWTSTRRISSSVVSWVLNVSGISSRSSSLSRCIAFSQRVWGTLLSIVLATIRSKIYISL